MNLQRDAGSDHSQRIVGGAKEFEFRPEANKGILKNVKQGREGFDWICV